MQISGRVVLVTGASEGIGAACVEEFRSRGAKVVLMARNEERLAQVASSDDAVVAGDVTRAEDRERALAAALSRWGRLDVLVNNAGIGVGKPAWQADMASTRYMFELNFFAPLEFTQLVVPEMRKQGGGAIVNVGSVAGKVSMPWFTLYSATKFALWALTDGLRMELKRDRIHTMLVCPGFVRTDFHMHVIGGPPPGALKRGRPGEITAQECARAIADGLERDARTVTAPRKALALIAAHRLFPNAVDRVLASKQGIDA